MSKDPEIISFRTLRQVIGLIGLFLPVILLLYAGIALDKINWPPSISHYYYTDMGNFFVGALCAVGVFLLCHKGYTVTPDGAEKDPWDQILSMIAGGTVILVALFPTNETSQGDCGFFNVSSSCLRNSVHYLSATIFFTSLGFISAWRFTKSKHSKSERSQLKVVHNRIFRVSASVIFGCIAIMALNELLHYSHSTQFTITFESIALIAFGIAWLVKGEALPLNRFYSDRTGTGLPHSIETSRQK